MAGQVVTIASANLCPRRDVLRPAVYKCGNRAQLEENSDEFQRIS